jgi:hypothetical protein
MYIPVLCSEAKEEKIKTYSTYTFSCERLSQTLFSLSLCKYTTYSEQLKHTF